MLYVERKFKRAIIDLEQYIKDYLIGICFFSAKHAAFVKKGQRHGWLGVGIRIICPSKATYVSANCCFNELTLLKFN
jgi:hypothetical protein